MSLPYSTFYSIHACDDHEIVTNGIMKVLSEIKTVTFSYSNSKEDLMEYLKIHPVNLLILDINVKSQNMLALLPDLKVIQPNLKVILFTNYNTGDILKEVLKHDIYGFLDKTVSSKELLTCLFSVLENKKYFSYESKKNFNYRDKYELLQELTERELDVLKLLVQGKTNKQIADDLFISILTVQTHRKNMYQKLQLKGVNELVSFAYENNLY
jgi:DNA-binding NarL/FixJ family response regulator